jgi:hypothetical protein
LEVLGSLDLFTWLATASQVVGLKKPPHLAVMYF